jgi:trans-2,3-dihydro-3-hydroxyanthranilate isomerase
VTTYQFHQLDVFTDRALSGNPLAVFPEAAGLDDAHMQALAREMNLSETSFVFPSKRATRRLRFFTPTAEVPLPGHPTVGTWWLLATLGEIDLPDEGTHEVTQETQAGVLPIEIQMAGGAPKLVVMTQAPPEFGPVVQDTHRLAELLGGGSDLIPEAASPQVVSTGIPQLMIPTASLAALEALPSGGKGGELAAFLREFDTDCAMCYATETKSPEATVHCRMFAPGLGVPEDPATGSASGALGAYLVHHGIVSPSDGAARVVVEQGIEIGRASRIDVRIATTPEGAVGEVQVGGQAVTFIEGEVRL